MPLLTFKPLYINACKVCTFIRIHSHSEHMANPGMEPNSYFRDSLHPSPLFLGLQNHPQADHPKILVAISQAS